MLTPQACIFTWIVFSRETFPLLKRCIMEAGRTYQSADRGKTFRSLTMLHVVLSGAIFKFPSLQRVELEGKYVFWISERAAFSVWGCLLHSCAITVRCLVASGKAAQTGRERTMGSANVQEASSNIYRSTVLPLRCLSRRWRVIPHVVHWIPAKEGKMEHLFDVWPSSGTEVAARLQSRSAQIQDGGRPLRLSAPQQCLCPHSVSDAMSARLQDSAFKEESKWDLASHPDTARTFFALLISCCARLLRARRFTTTACLFFSVSAVSIAQWHRGSS